MAYLTHLLTIALMLCFLSGLLASVTFNPDQSLPTIATETDGTLMNRWSRAPAAANVAPTTESDFERRQSPSCTSTSCPGLPIDLNAVQQNTVLNVHNALRANLSNPSPLRSLPSLTWDSGLANIWKSHPLQCKFQHTTNEWRSNNYAQATSRPAYPTTYVGENLAYYAQFQRCTSNTIDSCQKVYTYNLNDLLFGWGAEKKCYNYSKVGSDICPKQCYQSLYSDGCGHYTQQIWGDTQRVGCLVLNCTQYDIKSPQYGFILVCAYAPGGNYVGSYPYHSSIPGSKRSEDVATTANNNIEPNLQERRTEQIQQQVEPNTTENNVNIINT